MSFSYRNTALYRKLMKRPATWREDIRKAFKGVRHVSRGVHDIPAVRNEYLHEIRLRIYLLFYVDCKPLLPVKEFRRLLRRYCRLTDEEYDLLCEEYVEAYNPPMRRREAGPRSLFDQVCHVIHAQCENDDATMRQLPLQPQEIELLLWKPHYD